MSKELPPSGVSTRHGNRAGEAAGNDAASSSSSSPSSSPAAAAVGAVDTAALLQALVASQQQMQQAQLVAQQQQQADRAQLQAVLQLLAQHQSAVITQQKESSTKSLARTSAGAAPFFKGESHSITTYRWLKEMERWFATAEMIDKAEMITNAVRMFGEPALQWWNAEAAGGRTASYNTWPTFREAVMKRFSPEDVETGARRAIMELVNRRTNPDVVAYSQQYNELDVLIPKREEADRLLYYIQGLPESYRIKAMEKKHKTLLEAVESSTLAYTARRVAGASSSPSLHQMEATSEAGSVENYSPGRAPSSSSSAVEGGPERVSSLQEQVAQLTKLMTEQYQNRGGYNRGGGSWNRGGGGGRGRSRSNSPTRSRKKWHEALGITEEELNKRIEAGVCVGCKNPNHIHRDCPQRKKKEQGNE